MGGCPAGEFVASVDAVEPESNPPLTMRFALACDRPSRAAIASTSGDSRPSRIDLYSCRHAGNELNILRHLIELNTNRHALGKAHEAEDWVNRSESRCIRPRVGDMDAARDALHLTSDQLAVTHKLDGCWCPLTDRSE